MLRFFAKHHEKYVLVVIPDPLRRMENERGNNYGNVVYVVINSD
jgi:hypothetical protein